MMSVGKMTVEEYVDILLNLPEDKKEIESGSKQDVVYKSMKYANKKKENKEKSVRWSQYCAIVVMFQYLYYDYDVKKAEYLGKIDGNSRAENYIFGAGRVFEWDNITNKAIYYSNMLKKQGFTKANTVEKVISHLWTHVLEGKTENKNGTPVGNKNNRMRFKELAEEGFGVMLDDDTQKEEKDMAELNYGGYKGKIIEAITNEAKQIILTGAPGTGKTRMAKEIAKEMGAKLLWKDKNKPKDKNGQGEYPQYELVQFHPSYDYTDFVEGLRPVEDKNKVEFKKLDGIFKSFCRHVAENGDKDKNYFFIIDEINRADLSKVFGELMYCLESDKRGTENKIQTQYKNLTQFFTERENREYLLAKEKDEEKRETITKYRSEELSENEKVKDRTDIFKDGFFIPENVIIIGTMNDIDRSVESMDYALRRRFLWREIEVNKMLLKDAFGSPNFWGENAPKILTKEADDLAERVMNLNKLMTDDARFKDLGLTKQHYISQGQFANLPKNILEKASENDMKPFLDEVWEWRIALLLREYVRGESEADIKNFMEACKKTFSPDPSTKKDDGNNQATSGQDNGN